MPGVRILAAMALAGGLFAPISIAAADTKPADLIYYNANVRTMDADMPRARAVAIRGKTIVGVGRRQDLEDLVGPQTQQVDLGGATIAPGFIDPHSHFLGYAAFANDNFWTDVSSVNLYFKPLPGDPRCKDPTDYGSCFIPVRNQNDVVTRIKAQLATNASGAYAAGYDASRLGHGTGCNGPATRVGFACPSFEDGKARATLDALSSEKPIYISAQSGHVAWVNTKALEILNICGTDVATDGCYEPNINAPEERALANLGQLDEDLALYGDAMFTQRSADEDPEGFARGIAEAMRIYAGHGYTLVQEGAASTSEASIYIDLMTADPAFPFTVGLMVYETTKKGFGATLSAAKDLKAKIAGLPPRVSDKLFVAGVKTFADGSPQGLTGYMTEPYKRAFPPFNKAPFEQPYAGLPDIKLGEMRRRVVNARGRDLPLMIHQNGDQATKDATRAFTLGGKKNDGIRDISLHIPFVSEKTLSEIRDLGNTASFLVANIYYWGLPLCQQVLGSEVVEQRYAPYPLASAEKLGLNVTLHTDSPVQPPDPLFTIWVAKTRKVQQPEWYPNINPKRCPAVNNPEEAISIEQGLRAWTINAAWQYGLEKERGSVTKGKYADLVILSDDPVSMEDHPDRLRDIRVLATVNSGVVRPNPAALEAPIWPE